VIALRGLGGGIRRKFVLLRLDGFQVKVEIVDVGVLKPIKSCVGPLGLLVLFGVWTLLSKPNNIRFCFSPTWFSQLRTASFMLLIKGL
jgi:hypothetical protein